MTVTKQLIDNVNKIKTTLNEISVYNLDVKTSLELYYELAKKVNEVINELSRFEGVVSDEVVEQNKKLIYLLGEGLKEQVGLKIDELISNGTMDSIINHKIFNDLNSKIDTFKQEVSEQFNTIQSELEGVCNNIKSILCDDGQYVKGDGVHDDTTGINNAFKKYKHVILRDGNYLIDTYISIKPPNGCTLEIQPSAKIVAKASNSEGYNIIDLTDSADINIFGGGKIIGDRDIHIGSTGEWGMGINLRGSTNILIKDIDVNDCWGDGIYIGKSSNKNYCENIKIYNVKCDNNRRQGISLISCKNLDIDEATLCNTNGTAPQSGIDIEPNSTEGEILENIRIGTLNTYNNAGAGVMYIPNNVSNSIDITISEINSNNECALSVTGTSELVTGTLIINSINSKNAPFNGISFSNFVAPNLKFILKNVSIIDNNNNLSTSDLYSGGIAFLTNVNNIYIDNYYYSSKNGSKNGAISCNISLLSVNNVINNLTVGTNRGYIYCSGKVDILNSNMVFVLPSSATISSSSRSSSYLHNTKNSLITLTDNIDYNNKMTIINEIDGGLDFVISETSTLKYEGLNASMKQGGKLSTRDIGASITLSKKDNVWKVLSINGNWTYA